MQFCKRCRITVHNPRSRCPLCQGALEGTAQPENQMFPDLERDISKRAWGFRIFSFVCIVICVAALSVNWVMGFGNFWSEYVLAGIACMWILTAVAIQKRRNLLKNAVWETMVLWSIFLFWDFITGFRGWSVDFGIPVVLLSTYVVLWTIVFITKTPVSHYMIYMILAAIGSLVPLTLLLCKVTTVKIPSVLCVAGAVLMISSLAIFKSRAMWEEVKKKTHL